MPSTPTEPVTLPIWQLPLAQVCDSAAPTGAFAHSFGLETYVSEGSVDDGPSFTRWLAAMLGTQFAHSDGLAVRLVHEHFDADGQPEALWEVDRALFAQALPEEVRRANETMGRRSLAIARRASPGPWWDAYGERLGAGTCHGHPAVVVGLLGASLGAPLPVVLGAHLQALAITLTQNAVRLIPLGQEAGQQAIADVAGVVATTVEAVLAMDPDDFGAVPIGLEVAQMRHERLRARMYMS